MRNPPVGRMLWWFGRGSKHPAQIGSHIECNFALLVARGYLSALKGGALNQQGIFGKIMRRILRKIVDNELDDLGGISTLVDS